MKLKIPVTSIHHKPCFLVVGTILTAVFILELLHVYNGFPLLLADSKGYIAMGLKAQENNHWSNTYINFVAQHIRQLNSLQWIPFFQNITLVSSLYAFIIYDLGKRANYKFLIITLLLLLSSLPWMSNVIMSDIFTPISLMIIYILLTQKIEWKIKLIFLPLLFFSASCHQSNMLIIPLFTVFVIFIKWLFKIRNINRDLLISIGLIFILFITSFQLEKSILRKKNVVSYDRNERPVKNTNISSGYYFVAVRTWEVGELDNLLAHFCRENGENYLCDPNNPFEIRVKINKAKDRTQDNLDYKRFSEDNKEFVVKSLTNPRFYYALSKAALKRGIKLLRKTGIRPYHPMEGPTVKQNIRKISLSDHLAFLESRQMRDSYGYEFIRNDYKIKDRLWWLLSICIVVLLSFLNYKDFKKVILLSNHQSVLLICLVMAHFINVMICGTFSNADNVRYSSRTIWLINLAIILVIMFLFETRSKLSNKRR